MAAGVLLALATGSALAEEQPKPRGGLAVPSFLGTDGVKALEEAQAAIKRELEALRQREIEAKAQRRRDAEAEAKRRAEDMRRQVTAGTGGKMPGRLGRQLEAEEEGARRRADERMRNLAVMPMTAPSQPAAASAAIIEPGPLVACGEPRIAGKALQAGLVSISLQSPCRAGQTFQIAYGSAAFQRIFDANGRAEVVFDMFLGRDEKLAVVLADGARHEVAVTPTDLEKVSKVAVLWSAPVNLDLHAFAHAARFGEPEHVWAGAPFKRETAVRVANETGQGAGFLSMADDGSGAGMKAEVYTFVHGDADVTGTVALALDYASRGDVPEGEMCGDGALAAVDFEVIVLTRDGTIGRESGRIASVPCGKPLSEPVRYRRSVVPDLKIRK